ncbi:MAG: nicotinamide riboside transporter PnuC [Flavobacteriaceae bacterium]|jgi:nicotinamide mononucleotide transporter|nr:nicotinamide riboside transporter PnuC [Flavobacteriaceae bacterium]
MKTTRNEKIFRILWYAAAISLTIYYGVNPFLAGETTWYNMLIFMGTALLGYFCVSTLVERSPVLGNVSGMSANVGEMYTQFYFGNIGMVFSALYYFITHLIGLNIWTKKENQDSEGKIKIANTNRNALILTVLFCLAGIAVMCFWGHKIIKEDNQFLFVLNVIAFVIGISAQFVMIMRQPFSWILWSICNVVWLVLNLISNNYIFAVQSVLYEINAVIGIYKWYKYKEILKP